MHASDGTGEREKKEKRRPHLRSAAALRPGAELLGARLSLSLPNARFALRKSYSLIIPSKMLIRDMPAVLRMLSVV